MNQQSYFSAKALANKWGMSYQTLQNWRNTGFGPTYLRIGGCIRYTPEAVKEFERSPEFAERMVYVKRKQGAQS